MSTETYTPNQHTTGPSRPRRWVLAVVAAVAVAGVALALALTLGNAGNLSIVSGWFPVFLFWATVAVCLIAVALRRDVLKEFAIGIPIGIAFVVLLFVGLRLTQAIPAGAPRSMYVWLCVACLMAWPGPGRMAAGSLAPPHRRCGRDRPRRGVGGQRGESDVRVLPDLCPPVRPERQPLPGQCAAHLDAPGGGQERQAARSWRHLGGFHPGDQPEVHAPAGVRVGAPGVVRALPASAAGHRAACTAFPASLRTGLARATPMRRRWPSPSSTTGWRRYS